jgi:RHS repeat-associated protein
LCLGAAGKIGTPNGLNQLTSYGAKSLTHDSKGNVTAFGAKSFTYSSENLLQTGPNSASLTYDPAMRLYQATGASSTTRFAYDGLDRIAEHDGANALLRRYVHGPGMDEPIVWYEGTGTTDRRFLSADERGSVVSVTDSAGAVLGLNRYDEFGQPQAGNLGAFGYTGQAWLPEIGAWYYKARVYEPELGRFLQPDPIGYEGGMNLYAYVGGDPVNFSDPLGLMRAMVTYGGSVQCYSEVDSQMNVTHTYFCGDPGEILVVARPRERGGLTRGTPQLPDSRFSGGCIIRGDCPGLEPVPRPQAPPKFNSNKNYCGPEGGREFPSGMWNQACYNHDICYGTVGAVKSNCDTRFRKEIITSCPLFTTMCGPVAVLYWVAVKYRVNEGSFNPKYWRKP